jgi:DNA-binding transcriptional ArsR family regulator
MHAGIEHFDMPDPELVDGAAETLRILSDSTRLKILIALAQGESSVACLAELSDANATAVSQHLAKLRLAGLVRARREGTFMYYTIVDQRIPAIVETVIAAEREKGSAARTA